MHTWTSVAENMHHQTFIDRRQLFKPLSWYLLWSIACNGVLTPLTNKSNYRNWNPLVLRFFSCASPKILSLGTTTNFWCRLFKQSRTSLSWRINLVYWNLNFTIEGCVCYFHQILHLKDDNTRKSNLIYKKHHIMSMYWNYCKHYIDHTGLNSMKLIWKISVITT